MLDSVRDWWHQLVSPIAKALLRAGVPVNAVTWLGAIATCVVALVCFPQGWLWQGVLLQLLFVLSDTLDGTMARLSGQQTTWGAFLDSTLDRVADGALFAGVILYYAGVGDSLLWAAVGLGALVFAQVTSYAKARGEAVGIPVSGGLVTRADRVTVLLLGALLSGLGLGWALPAALSFLCGAGLITVLQRMAMVHRATRESDFLQEGVDGA